MKTDEEIGGMSLPELANELKEAKDAHDALKRQKADAWNYYQKLAVGVLPDKMNEMGVRNLSMESGFRLHIHNDARCTVNAEQKPKLQAWLRERGVLEDLTTETINSGTLKAYMKERDRNCEELPDEDAITYTPYQEVRVTKTS